MSENVLKREFKGADVQRLRNLVSGKSGEKTTSGIGYTKVTEFHNEGDIWSEGGRQWTITNGIKMNITKLDEARKEIHLPLFCPSCHKLMKHRYDKQFYISANHCFDCQINYEAKLKQEGKFESQIKETNNSDIDATIRDFNIYIDEMLNSTDEVNISEDGVAEKWDGSSKQAILKQKEEAITFLENLKQK